MAGIGERAQNGMGVMNGRRHQYIGFAAGIAEHDALVAGTLVLVAATIDAHGDIA